MRSTTPAHLVLGADRDLGRDDVRAEGGLERLERAEEVGPLAVEHVHEDERARGRALGALPEALACATSTPITALTTKTRRLDDAQRAERVGHEAGSPGVSIRLILRSSQSNEASAAQIDISRSCSSVSESETVVPSATVPSRLIAPGLEQQRLEQRRLPAAAVADQGDVADPVWRPGACLASSPHSAVDPAGRAERLSRLVAQVVALQAAT